MRLIFSILFIISSLTASAQQLEATRRPEQMPECPYNLSEYFAANLHYPKAAMDRYAEGKVLVEFVIDETGKITDPVIKKSVDLDLNKEALRVVANMPAWKPGRQNGKNVRVYYTLPVVYKLPD